jgi:hypothetical protein
MTPENKAPEQIWLIPDTIEGIDLAKGKRDD